MHLEPWYIVAGELFCALMNAHLLIWRLPALRRTPRCSWFWIAMIWMLRVVYCTHRHAGWCSLLATGIFVWLALFDGTGHGKKIWGKIRSAALTAVNELSFRNQTKQAWS
jgi:hypothetical protein